MVENFPASTYGFFYKGHGGPAKTDLAKGLLIQGLLNVDPNERLKNRKENIKNKRDGHLKDIVNTLHSKKKV